ncbi:recombinase family protein [uncultured Brevundimonas sp.]|uniref:recombinase family protein n=1 Tax=uncultured Brevundimonas sp. TaxID=213418 RepID=UPI002608847A|nr:recombinase family protein [uncultured Brevundimonas sp.]
MDEFSEDPLLIGYARPSLRDQSPETQLAALNVAGCERIFIETLTGAQRDRPELKLALEEFREGDTLVIWKLDRLAKSVRQLTETVAELQQRQVSLRILAPDLSSEMTSGDMVFRFFAAVAEFDRELALERSSKGLAAAKALGRRGGRKPAMGPSDISRAKRLLMDANVTVEEVAKQMGVQPSTLYRHIPGGRSSLAHISDG